MNYDLDGKTVSVPFVLKDGDVLKNGTIVCNSGIAVQCYGSLGSFHSIKSQGPDWITLDHTSGIQPGTWLILRSSEHFSPIDQGKCGEWVRVVSVGARIHLEQFVRHAYTECYKPILPRVRIESVRFVGSGEYGFRGYLCRSPRLTNCTADGFKYSAFSLETCLGGYVEGCDADRGDHATGAAYGVSVSGDGISVIGGRFSSLRHGVTVGDTFMTTRGVTVQGVNAVACSDAGIDAHPNCLDTAITGNTVEVGSVRTEQTGDGIVSQGAGTAITANTVRNARREGIMIQTLTAYPGNCSLTGNLINGENGIIIQHRMPWPLKASAAGNVMEHKNRGLQIEANLGGKVTAALSGNIGARSIIGDVELV